MRELSKILTWCAIIYGLAAVISFGVAGLISLMKAFFRDQTN